MLLLGDKTAGRCFVLFSEMGTDWVFLHFSIDNKKRLKLKDKKNQCTSKLVDYDIKKNLFMKSWDGNTFPIVDTSKFGMVGLF